MKKHIIILWAVLLVGCGTDVMQDAIVNAEEKEITNGKSDEISKIAILGTFHFGATSDYTAVQMDSFFFDKRQKELDELVSKIKEFNPTKIMVEWEPGTKDSLDYKLNKYLNNEFSLRQNEIYQIGFRLAKETGITESFPVDYQMDLGDDKLVEYLNEIDKFSEFISLISDVTKVATADTEYLKSHSILGYFREMNSVERDNFNRNIYLDKLAKISTESGNPLLAYVSKWYMRNIYIMGHMDRHIQQNNRVLLLIGAGHKPILKDLYINRKNIEYIEIHEYLE